MELRLDRERVAFFPLAWTIVHPIDEGSPLKDITQQELIDCDGEFLVLLKGYDDASSQTVQARSSYRAEEVVVGARFIDMFDHEATHGELSVDVSKLHGFQRD